jgi:hypothetical protein
LGDGLGCGWEDGWCMVFVVNVMVQGHCRAVQASGGACRRGLVPIPVDEHCTRGLGLDLGWKKLQIL